jgi:hypothetical protein
VEWSENVVQAMEGAIKVRIQTVCGKEDVRRITIEGGVELADFSL